MDRTWKLFCQRQNLNTRTFGSTVSTCSVAASADGAAHQLLGIKASSAFNTLQIGWCQCCHKPAAQTHCSCADLECYDKKQTLNCICKHCEGDGPKPSPPHLMMLFMFLTRNFQQLSGALRFVPLLQVLGWERAERKETDTPARIHSSRH